MDVERIAANLAEQLTAADSAIHAGAERLATAELLAAAYLAAVFDGAECRCWGLRQIGEVAPIQTGFAFKSEWFVQQGGTGIRVLRNANIHQGLLTGAMLPRFTTTFQESLVYLRWMLEYRSDIGSPASQTA